MENKSNFKRGSVELLLLHLLNEEDCYGYELSKNINTRSNGILEIPIDYLYAALYKLIDKGFITDYKKSVGKRMVRVYYRIEQKVKERLKVLLEDYYSTNNGIQSVLKY